MVGLQGRVTGTIGPGLVGEVMVRVRGGAEHFLAYPIETGERIETGTLVVDRGVPGAAHRLRDGLRLNTTVCNGPVAS